MLTLLLTFINLLCIFMLQLHFTVTHGHSHFLTCYRFTCLLFITLQHNAICCLLLITCCLKFSLESTKLEWSQTIILTHDQYSQFKSKKQNHQLQTNITKMSETEKNHLRLCSHAPSELQCMSMSFCKQFRRLRNLSVIEMQQAVLRTTKGNNFDYTSFTKNSK